MNVQAGKKGKKKAKGKTVSLNDFLGDSQAPGLVKQIDWADEADDEYRSVNSSLTYQSTSAQKVIQLPTAPRASRTIEIDHSRIPENGPFTAFVGNLPYEVNQMVLEEFFKDLSITNVRLPEENGRFKGYGYVQFGDRQSLIKALEMNDETLQKRNIRIDIADNQTKESGGSYGRQGDRYGSQSGPDPTEGNWRKADPDDSSRQSNYNDRRDRNDEYDGGNRYRKSSRDYDGYERKYGDRQGGYGNRGYGDRRYSDKGYNDRGYNERGYSDRGYNDRGYNDRGYNDRGSSDRGYSDRGYSDKGYDDRNRGYERSNYGSRGYDRQRTGDRYGRSRDDEPPKERAPLRLQPRQKPLEDGEATAARSSSIFGAAKPVDTSAKERAIEEKLYKQQKSVEENKTKEKRSGNIFGQAKPIDTTAREREMEEKIAAAKKERIGSTSKQPAVSARASVFGDAKPVDTSAREKEIEEKLMRGKEQLMNEVQKDDRETDRRSRISSHRSDEYGHSSPRRSRNSSVRSSDEHGESSSQKTSDSSKEAKKAPVYKPAPMPKENAWGKKSFTADKPAVPTAIAKRQNSNDFGPSSSAWSKPSVKDEQRGEREEAEGSRDEEDERIPEGAADEEDAMMSRNDPGDGSEERQEGSYASSARRDHPRYRSDRPSDSYQNRRGGKYGAGKQGTGSNRNRNYNDGYHENRRRGDGDSQSYRNDAHSNNYSSSSARNKRDNERARNRNDWSEKRRDSSRDSRPECDRSDGAGQEQPTSSGGKASKAKSKTRAIEKEETVDFVSQSKFALLSVDDSD